MTRCCGLASTNARCIYRIASLALRHMSATDILLKMVLIPRGEESGL